MASRLITWILGFAFCYGVLMNNTLGWLGAAILSVIFIATGFDLNEKD